MLNKTNVLGVGITNAKKDEVLEYVVENLEKKTKKFYIVTPNPEFLVLANKKKDFKKVLNDAEVALNDGVGLGIAARFLGKPLSDRFSGVDFVEMLCSRISDRPITVGFLGGREGIAEATSKCLVRKYPGLRVVFAGSDWSKNDLSSKMMINDERIKIKDKAKTISNRKSLFINQPIDILFVAFGFPKQEEWISTNVDKDIYRVAVGVGGSFDYISGRIVRAPKFLRAIGLEWFFRLIVQPWRWRRQLALLEFIGLTIKEKFRI